MRQLFPEDNEKQDPFERVDNDENDRLLDREGSPDFKPKKKKKGKLKSNAEELNEGGSRDSKLFEGGDKKEEEENLLNQKSVVEGLPVDQDEDKSNADIKKANAADMDDDDDDMNVDESLIEKSALGENNENKKDDDEDNMIAMMKQEEDEAGEIAEGAGDGDSGDE